MTGRELENNKVYLIGEVKTQYTLNHEAYGEKFYMIEVAVERTSGYMDLIPVLVSDRLTDTADDHAGEYIEIHGQIRTFNMHEKDKNRLIVCVFAKDIRFLGDEDSFSPTNDIYLDGYICKPTVYRETPLGKEIADILLAVNRPYKKSDYIPCICWGRNARWASGLEVGDRIKVRGRFQSREYQKRISENETETREAYEISIAVMEEANEEGTD